MTTVEIGPESEFARAGGGAIEVRADEEQGPSLIVVAEPDWERVELVRRLGCRLDDGGLLALAAARPRGAAGHGDEAVSLTLIDADGEPVEIAAARLSTEYDPAGTPRRIGLELVPGDDTELPLRGAGTLSESGAFEFTLDGTPGAARYELAKPD